MTFMRMSDLDLTNKRVLIRQDLNVPVQNGKISNDARLQASLPTLRHALDQSAAVILCSHLGRPNPDDPEEKFSLQPVAAYLTEHLGQPVRLVKDYLDQSVELKAGELVLLENVRFNQGEKSNEDTLAQQYANLCDVYVMDAFGTAHRKEASTEGVIRFAKQACAGTLLASELDALAQALESPARPMVAIVGGAKVSSKLSVIKTLSQTCDAIVVGGGIANTFYKAAGYDVGASLYEPDLVDTAKQIMQQVNIPLPERVMVANRQEIDFECFIDSLEQASVTSKHISELTADDMIVDIDPDAMAPIQDIIAQAKTILWNGPLGVFEVDSCGLGTQKLAQLIGRSAAFSVAGGGETLSAIAKYQVADKISYVSTGGGAFLEYVEGSKLPVVASLELKAIS